MRNHTDVYTSTGKKVCVIILPTQGIQWQQETINQRQIINELINEKNQGKKTES